MNLVSGFEDYSHLFSGRSMRFAARDLRAETLTVHLWGADANLKYWHVERICADGICEGFRKPAVKEMIAYVLRNTWCVPPDHGWAADSDDGADEAGDAADIARARRHNVVYFLQAGPFIKIGFTGGLVQLRVDQLKTGCPYDIRVLATMDGGQSLEHRLHRQFKHHLSSREWFHAHEEILAFVREHAHAA